MLAALLLSAAAFDAAQASPDESGPDAIQALLIERGELAHRVRDKAGDLVLAAMNFLGAPYRRGGSAEDGFDCSGFTRHIFSLSAGLVLPRRVDDQAKAPGLAPVARDALRPGDLVFFNTLKRTFSHVGIYLGDGKFIHAPRSGTQVRVESMNAAYWTRRFTGARRAVLADGADHLR